MSDGQGKSRTDKGANGDTVRLLAKNQHQGVKVVFADFDDFLDWAIESNFLVGKRIGRIDTTGPFSRDNCVWMNKMGDCEESDEERAARWDAFVEPIRERFKDTLAELEAQKREKEKLTVFQYEHPDLVREGIVFEASR